MLRDDPCWQPTLEGHVELMLLKPSQFVSAYLSVNALFRVA
jgi:hypothetical protein